MNFFCADDLCVAYGSTQILHHLSFSARAGEITGILGANGCGKTTLLKAICGILPHGGSCTLAGEKLDGLSPRQIARKCSYIPQRSGISIDISALDVVLMGFNPALGLLEQPGARMRSAALEALGQLDLADRAQDNYLTLSEGQKQLCLLARALASGSRLLLLDEPESALDFRHRYRMAACIREWIARDARAALIVLHDPQLALSCCDQLVLIDRGKTAAVLRPQTDDVSEMEAALRQIYGEIQLAACTDRHGKTHLVMLSEEGGYPCSP